MLLTYNFFDFFFFFVKIFPFEDHYKLSSWTSSWYPLTAVYEYFSVKDINVIQQILFKKRALYYISRTLFVDFFVTY